MTFLYLSYLEENWWIILTFVFGLFMFFGRRLEPILEWLADRKIQKLYPTLSRKYLSDLFDENAYLSEALGVDIKLDDLMKRVLEINERLIENKIERVSYLELWILVKLYGEKMVKSENHIYFVNTKNFIKNLDLSFRDLNFWTIEFANSEEIREKKIAASFLLHKIRVKDPDCDPKNNLWGSPVAGVVFDREYFFSSEDVSNGTIATEEVYLELSNGDIIAKTEKSGIHNLGRKSKMSIKDKINFETSYQTNTVPYVAPGKEKVINEKKTTQVTQADGSKIEKDERGRVHKTQSNIDGLKKVVNAKEKENVVIQTVIQDEARRNQSVFKYQKWLFSYFF